MFENIHYKQKRIIILVIFLLLFVATYKKVFKQTFNTVNYYYKLKNQKVDSVSLKNNITNLKLKISEYDRILGNNVKIDLLQQDILSYASAEADSNKINIISLDKQHVFSANGINVYSNFLEIEGQYNAILKTIYSFENKFNKSKINSINLYVKKDYKRKKNKLYAKLLFQNFKKTQ